MVEVIALLYIKKFVIEEFVIRVFHCIILCGNGSVHVGCDSTHPLVCSKDRGFQSPWTSPRGGTSWRCSTHIFSCPISVQLVRRGNITRFNPSYYVSLSIHKLSQVDDLLNNKGLICRCQRSGQSQGLPLSRSCVRGQRSTDWFHSGQ